MAMEAANGRVLLSPAPIESQLGHDMRLPIQKPPIHGSGQRSYGHSVDLSSWQPVVSHRTGITFQSDEAESRDGFADPILYERNAKSLFHMYKSSTTEDKKKPALIFCLALKLMSQRPPDDVARSCLLAGGRSQDADPRRELRQALKWCMIDRLISNSKLDLYCRALWGQGIMCILLREALVQGTVDVPPTEIVVPTTESINFHHLMDMPPPFATNTLSDFRFCHLSKMISKSYFEDGEWVGFYYTAFSRFEPRHFHPPMRNVRFITNFDPARTPSHSLSARGQDATGQFSLQARLEDESGKISVNQKYAVGKLRRYWTCMLTPFGIVGTWGEGISFEGWLWLWKVQ